MKLIASLDRACETRMRSAARPRLLLLALIGFALVAPLLSGSAIAAATGADKPATLVASTALLGGLALTGPLREEDPGHPAGGGCDPKADDDTKLTIGARLSAAIASKASLQAEIADLKGKLATAESACESNQQTFQAMSEQLNQANAKIATLEADASEVDKALKTAEAEAAGLKATEKTVEKKAQELTSQLGFSAAKLPAADDVDPDDAVPSSRAELESAMDKLPTAQERSALLARYRKSQTASAIASN